jgi:hypothetical protein
MRCMTCCAVASPTPRCTHGGCGFAAEYDVERNLCESRPDQVAPISANLILSCGGEHVLEMPGPF